MDLRQIKAMNKIIIAENEVISLENIYLQNKLARRRKRLDVIYAEFLKFNMIARRMLNDTSDGDSEDELASHCDKNELIPSNGSSNGNGIRAERNELDGDEVGK